MGGRCFGATNFPRDQHFVFLLQSELSCASVSTAVSFVYIHIFSILSNNCPAWLGNVGHDLSLCSPQFECD